MMKGALSAQKQKKAADINQITEGVIWKQLLLFFFPILLGSLFQQLYNTADTMIVGRFVGKIGLAAVGSCGRIYDLLIQFFMGLATGGSVVIAQYYGSGDEKHVSQAVHTAIATAIVGGVLLLVIGQTTANAFLSALKVPENVMGSARSYLRIIYIGMVPTMLYNMGTGVLRAIGNTKTPLYILMVCCFVNIGLDILFVLVLHMGVAGAALATVLSQTISALLVFYILMHSSGSYRVEPGRIRFERIKFQKIIRIGIPTGLQSSMYGISNLFVMGAINVLGTDVAAAWSALGKIDGFLWMVMGAFGMSITTFVGQNFGAGRYDRVKQSVRQCMIMAMPVIAAISMVFYFFGPQLFGVFCTDPDVINAGYSTLRILCPFYVFFVFVEVLSGTIRGSGESFRPMVITCMCNCVFRIFWVLCIVPLWPGTEILAWCYPITWVMPGMIFIVYYLRMNWLKRCIQAKTG